MPIEQITTPYHGLIIATATIASIFFFASIVGIFCWIKYDRTSKNRKIVFTIWLFIGAVLFVLQLSLLFMMWPREYTPLYIQIYKDTYKALSLRQVATKVGFMIGATVRNSPMCDKHLLNWEYNSVIHESLLSWNAISISGEYDKLDFITADYYVDTYLQNGIRVWGRSLFETNNIPNSVSCDVFSNGKNLTTIVNNHVTKVMEHFIGRITHWTVIENLLDDSGDLIDNVMTQVLGENFIELAFKKARNIDPLSKLYITETFDTFDPNNSKLVSFVQLIKRLIARNTPIDGIGISTFGAYHVQNIDLVKEFMEELVKLGLEIEITALDARLRLFSDAIDPYDSQGLYLLSWVSTCTAVLGCKGITFSGISDATAWYETVLFFQWVRPNEPYIFDKHGRRKPGWYFIVDHLLNLPIVRNDSLKDLGPFSTNFPSEELFSCEGENYIMIGSSIGKWIFFSLFVSFSIWLLIAVNFHKDRPQFYSEWWHKRGFTKL